MNEIKPVCVLQGPIASRSGYGDDCRDRAIAVLKSGKFDLKIAPTRWGGCPLTMLDDESQPWVKELKSCILTAPLQSRPELFIQVSIPNEFQPMGQFNIGVTAGIETTVPKAEWIEGLNRMDLNIVPSKFSKDVFTAASFNKTYPNGTVEPVKLNKPIEVSFEGIDVDVYKKTNEIDQSINDVFNGIPEEFCYLFVGHWLGGDIGADRKDIGMLVRIFSETFKNRKEKPALVLKTSGATFSQMDKHDILKKIHNARLNISGDLPNVYVIHGELTPTQLNSLYNHNKVKAHINFTHGEGFGRPLLEASLSGKPVLATGWSGQLDFLPSDLAVLLPYTLTRLPPSAVNEWLISESSWATVQYSLASQKMMDVYENYKSYLPNAEKLRIQNSSKFTMENGNKLFNEILEKYIPKFEKKVEFQLPKFKKI